MLFAAIDIGSNAVRLYFASVREVNQQIVTEKISLVRVPVRLGRDVFVDGMISADKTEKLIKTMQSFRLLIDVFEPTAYRACATSAMREAENGAQVIARVKEQAGIEITMIDGVKEAELLSALHSESFEQNHQYALYIDVGGGSTELSLLSREGLLSSCSFRIGTVRMLNNKVEKDCREKMKDWLEKHRDKFDSMLLVGSGGNINSLVKRYGRVPDKNLPFTNLEYAMQHLAQYTVNERINIMGLRPDRADVIVPAAEIFHYIMQTTHAQTLLVPGIGLIDGIVRTLYKEQKRKHENL